jgi:predicted O-methyltransferase YrrM
MHNSHRIITQIRMAIRALGLLVQVGCRHPSVLWHYISDNVRYLLVKFGILSGAAKQVAGIRAEFEEHAAQGQFTSIFFDADDWNIVQWCVTFSRIFNRADPVRILEIGSWEGRSTLFFLTYFTCGHLTSVDPWADSDGHQYASTPESQDRERRFDGNLAPYAARLTKRKGSSLHVLPQLLDEQQKFDVIYVDGSHFADDVLIDGINAWRLLKQDGILIFDDLLWSCYPRTRANPAWAITLFMKYHKGEYKILTASYQLVVQKKIAFTDHESSELVAFQFARAAET